MKDARIKIKVYGYVQGVFFRLTTRKVARRLGLTGYVKNLTDGNVEVFAEGLKEDLNKLLIALRLGPSFSQVDDVKVEWKEYQGKYKKFSIENIYF